MARSFVDEASPSGNRLREEIEKLMTKLSGGLAQKERENAILELLLDIRDLLSQPNKEKI